MVSKKEKIIFISLIALIALFSVLSLFLLTDIADALWPGHNTIVIARGELSKAQSEIKLKGAELASKRQVRRKFLSEADSYWIQSRDGNAEELIVRKVEEAAKNSKVSLNSLGNSKMSKVNEQFSFFDFNVEAVASMEDLSKFMVEIYKSNPRFFWTRCLIRPLKPDDSKELSLSGSLRVVCIDDPAMAEKIMKEEPR